MAGRISSRYCISKGALITLTKNTAFSSCGTRSASTASTWLDVYAGEDRIMKTYHNAQDGWLKKAEAEGLLRLLKPDEVARGLRISSRARSRA